MVFQIDKAVRCMVIAMAWLLNNQNKMGTNPNAQPFRKRF